MASVVNQKATGKPGTVGGGQEINSQTSASARSAKVGMVKTRRGSGNANQIRRAVFT